MKNDTAASVLLSLAMLVLVCAPAMAVYIPPSVCIIDAPANAANCPDDICVYYNTTCVNETRMTYPQEYYDAKRLADNHVPTSATWDASQDRYLENIFYELRPDGETERTAGRAE